MSVRELPASAGQRLLWLLDRQRGGDATLNCPVLCRMDGDLDVARLRSALAQLVARHEALRTIVERRGRRLWQVVHASADAPLVVMDESGAAAPAAVRKAVDDELRRPIDVSGFPVRAALWTIAPRRHVFCLNVHHLATDAWSGAAQIRDLRMLYAGARLYAPRAQYADFTVRQEAYFASDVFQRDTAFWRAALQGASFDALPFGPRGAPRVTGRARVAFTADESAGLIDLARVWRTTPFNVLLALYFVTLHRLTGRTDLTAASLFANRMRPDLHDTVGYLANLVAIRAIVRAGDSFRTFQAALQAHLRDAFIHQACPLHLLPSSITVCGERRADEAVFQMLPQALDTSRMGDVEITMMSPDGIDSRFDFEVTVAMEPGGAFALIVFWNERRLESAWVSAFLREYRARAAAALDAPDAPLG